jgi:hypothetical protein
MGQRNDCRFLFSPFIWGKKKENWLENEVNLFKIYVLVSLLKKIKFEFNFFFFTFFFMFRNSSFGQSITITSAGAEQPWIGPQQGMFLKPLKILLNLISAVSVVEEFFRAVISFVILIQSCWGFFFSSPFLAYRNWMALDHVDGIGMPRRAEGTGLYGPNDLWLRYGVEKEWTVWIV